VPDDQGQFGDLFTLLAQFHQSGFSASWIQQLGDPNEDLAILLADSAIHDGDRIRQTLSAHTAGAAGSLRGITSAVAVHGKAAIVLLLRRGGSSLHLGVLLGD
jgi:hypothetical protein